MRARTPQLLALLIVLVLVAGAVSALLLGRRDASRGVVEDYLDALHRGDVNAALAQVKDPHVKDVPLLTAKALPAGRRIGIATIRSANVQSKEAEYEIAFRAAGAEFTGTLTLERKGSHGLFQPTWKITNGVSVLNVSGASGATTVTVNGASVPVHDGKGTTLALPGIYVGALPTQFLLEGGSEPAVVSFDPGYLSMQLTVRAEAEAVARKAVEAGVRACFAKTRSVDSPCGTITFLAEDDRLVFTDVHWTVTRFPPISVDYDGVRGTFSVESTSSGRAHVTFTVSAPSIGPVSLHDKEDDDFTVGGEITFTGRTATWRPYGG